MDRGGYTENFKIMFGVGLGLGLQGRDVLRMMDMTPHDST